jgi:hypothetical protein
VLREGAKTREIQLPVGTWYDFWTGAEHKGGKTIAVPVTIASLPIFVREGGFVFRQSVVQHSGEAAKVPLQIDVYPAAASQARLYEDDGTSLGYTRGKFRQRTLVQRTTAGTSSIEIGAVQGSEPVPARRLVVRVRTPRKPRAVKLGDSIVKPGTGGTQPSWSWAPSGWTTVGFADGPTAARLSIELSPAP